VSLISANNCFAGEAGTACAGETAPVNGDPGVDESTATLLLNGDVLIARGERGAPQSPPPRCMSRNLKWRGGRAGARRATKAIGAVGRDMAGRRVTTSLT
jgi:hypothetical protein